MTTKTEKFMHVTERAAKLFGPASRGDAAAPVVHRHDEFEEASQEDLSHFEIETDSQGHHYATRRPGPQEPHS